VSAQQVVDQDEVRNLLIKASEVNRSLLCYGRIQAAVELSWYDEKGKKKREAAYEVRAVFKGEKVRLDRKEQIGNREKIWRAVATEEVFKEYFTGETSAYLRDPKMAEIIHLYSGFLPSRNKAFWYRHLEAGISREEELLSCKINRKDDEREVYIMELVWKKYPLDMTRYHIDSTKGGTIVRYESYHDFGEGHVLLAQAEAEMQPTHEGGWYLKRFTEVVYRRDGTLRRKEEIEIKNFDFTFEVLDAEFTWEAMGLPKGTRIHDNRLGINYTYDGPSEATQTQPDTTEKARKQIPEQAKVFLEAIRAGKSNREHWRSLYALMNKPAPELEVATWLQSKALRLADLRGKVVVLAFWGIDCAPCLGDIEGLNKIHERSASEPIVVIGVHHGIDDISEVERVMAKYKVKYPGCIDSGAGLPKNKNWSEGHTFQKYAVSAIPRPFLIDIKGRVRSVASPVDLRVLEELIKESSDGVTGTSSGHADWLLGVKVAPKRVSFNNLSVGQKAQKSVYIHKPDDPSFVVNIASAPAKPATAQLFRYEEKGASLYELRILFKADLQGENYASEIKLTTNDSRTPEIVIPVTASIASKASSGTR